MDKRAFFEKWASVINILQNRSQLQAEEVELWKKWKQGDQMALSSLLTSLIPLRKRISNNYRGNLPTAFVEGEVLKQTMKALQTWDPNAGAKLSTHIQNQCQKVLREIYKHQNPARLAEESHLKVPTYQNIFSNLQEQFGRPPSHLEMAREMKIGVGEARRLSLGARKDLSMIEGQMSWQPSEQQKADEILDLLYYELTPQEQQVLEYVYGRNGKQKLGTKDISFKMGISAARVSQIKQKIADKMNYHFGGQHMQTSQFY